MTSGSSGHSYHFSFSSIKRRGASCLLRAFARPPLATSCEPLDLATAVCSGTDRRCLQQPRGSEMFLPTRAHKKKKKKNWAAWCEEAWRRRGSAACLISCNFINAARLAGRRGEHPPHLGVSVAGPEIDWFPPAAANPDSLQDPLHIFAASFAVEWDRMRTVVVPAKTHFPPGTLV